jgi:hypothetical protein
VKDSFIDISFMSHILACPARGSPSQQKHGTLLAVMICSFDMATRINRKSTAYQESSGMKREERPFQPWLLREVLVHLEDLQQFPLSYI